MEFRTEEEITKEIETLTEMKPRVLMRTFGDDNHTAIDAQLEVLSEVLNADEIYNRYDPTGDDDLDEDEGRAENVLDNALLAMQWMDGEAGVSAPSENWKSLCK